MTTITFTFGATPLTDGRARINMFVKQLEPTYTESPGEEWRAEKDAAQVVHDIVLRRAERGDDPDRLLRSGDLPPEADPIIWFAIGVTWDRSLKLPHYSRVGYERVNFEGRFTPVAQLAMELFDYTMSVLRKREKRDRRAKMEKMKNGGGK